MVSCLYLPLFVMNLVFKALCQRDYFFNGCGQGNRTPITGLWGQLDTMPTTRGLVLPARVELALIAYKATVLTIELGENIVGVNHAPPYWGFGNYELRLLRNAWAFSAIHLDLPLANFSTSSGFSSNKSCKVLPAWGPYFKRTPPGPELLPL